MIRLCQPQKPGRLWFYDLKKHPDGRKQDSEVLHVPRTTVSHRAIALQSAHLPDSAHTLWHQYREERVRAQSAPSLTPSSSEKKRNKLCQYSSHLVVFSHP